MLKVVDLFCGMGGATLGYENSGCKVVLAIDKWEEALETHSANIPDVPTLCCDISVIPLDEIPEADVYHLSPPCQSFSTSGKQEGFQSANGNLFLLSLNILKEKKPNIFIIENIKGLLSHLAKNPNIFAGFEEYHINQLLLNARDCGVCQSRERVFIIGIKKAFGYFEMPDKVKNNQTFQDVINAVEGNNYGLPEHSQSLIDKIAHIKQGGNVLDIPEEIRPVAFKNSYSRLYLDKLPPTITRNFNCPSSANCIHPLENRGLSVAEALFIQGFPTHWLVRGKSKNLQIGNAVPPKMIEWIVSGIRLYNEDNLFRQGGHNDIPDNRTGRESKASEPC